MSAKDAIALLHSMGFKARVSGYGKVASQQPKGGSAAKSGATVVLNLK
jgi:cell division protein FtsI (penicillin-binding protein 3)